MKTDFYTYAFLREDGSPYYIGKGRGRRVKRNCGRGCYRPKDPSRVIFLKTGLTEEEAYKHEIYMIFVFGRKDINTGILRNKTNGGDGGYLTSEKAREMAELSRQKYTPEELSEKFKKVQSKFTPQERIDRQTRAYSSRLSNGSGRPSDKLKKQIEVKINEDSFIFCSVREAARELGVSRHKLQRWATGRNKCTICGWVVRYI
jgi:hypothetical protein